MTTNTNHLHVHLGALQVRRRLKGHGFGVKRVETGGKKRAVIIHTATGSHLRQLEALFQDVIEAKTTLRAIGSRFTSTRHRHHRRQARHTSRNPPRHVNHSAC